MQKTALIRRFLYVVVVVVLLASLALVVANVACQIPTVYYADFRSVENKLTLMPDVTIMDSWKHEDVILEDFGFVIKVRNCPLIRVDFHSVREWYSPFSRNDLARRIHGIIAYSPSGSVRIITIDELNKRGLSVGTIPDVLAHLRDILEIIDNTRESDVSVRPTGNWMDIRYPTTIQ